MFTVRSVNKREYSNPYCNIQMDMSKMHISTTAVIASITREHGVFDWKQYPQSVNIEKFKDYLLRIRRLLKNKKVYIFMDNLSVHTSKRTQNYMSSLDMTPIFNVAYSPDFNPIE